MKHDINYDLDDFADILKEDDRYDRRAYAFVHAAIRDITADGQHISGQDLLEEFREYALDEFGPMTYTVLTEWGIQNCSDIGEIVFHLVDSKRIGKSDNDSKADFIGGYSFTEAFLDPYAAR